MGLAVWEVDREVELLTWALRLGAQFAWAPSRPRWGAFLLEIAWEGTVSGALLR